MFRMLKSIFMLDIASGLWVTLRTFFSSKVTVHYPEQSIPRSARFRGLHALRRYDNNEERCIACQLCEAACPSMAIKVIPYETISGKRAAETYEIDLFKCVFCGLCEESCPVGAIVETKEIHYVFYNQGDQILNKKILLAIGDRYEKEIQFDRENRD